MAYLLEDCWLLMGRAERQFDALQSEIAEFLKSNAATLVIDDDAQTGEKVLYFAEEPTLPRELGADLGQLVNNARTALDHLVYALAVEGGGNPQADKTAFPIFEDRDKYLQVRGRGTRKSTVRDHNLTGVDEKWRKKVDAVQPYRHGKRAGLDPLAVLSDIANGHKHKTLKPARVTIETPTHVYYTVEQPVIELVVRYDPRRRDHVSVEAKFDSFPTKNLINPGFVMQDKVPVDNEFRMGVIFGEPPRPVTLNQIKRAVQWSGAVLKWFEPAFDPGT